MTGLGLAPEGTALLVGLMAMGLAVLTLGILLGRWPVWLAAISVMSLAVVAAFLFRDPRRETPLGPTLILAPTDGRVLAVDSVEDPTYIGGLAQRVLIRSGLADVRVLRSPVDGVVDYTDASGAKSRAGVSTGRLRVLLEFDDGLDPLLIREGQLLDQAERAGLLPAGASLAVLVPLDLDVQVRPGARVRSGVSVLARAWLAP